MSDENKFCIDWPEPQTFTVPLPFGGALSAISDISQGVPTDCALLQSLMLQLAPMLAGMTCILRILAVIGALKDFANNPLDPTNVGKLVGKIGEMEACLGIVIDPCAIPRMVVAILNLIVKYLGCVIQALESILHFQVGLDFNAAAGNPIMLANLECAKKNSDRAIQSMNDSMQGIMPLIELVNMLLEIVGQKPIEMPKLTTPTLAGDSDPLAPIIAVRDALQQAVMVLSAICPP